MCLLQRLQRCFVAVTLTLTFNRPSAASTVCAQQSFAEAISACDNGPTASSDTALATVLQALFLHASLQRASQKVPGTTRDAVPLAPLLNKVGSVQFQKFVHVAS